MHGQWRDGPGHLRGRLWGVLRLPRVSIRWDRQPELQLREESGISDGLRGDHRRDLHRQQVHSRCIYSWLGVFAGFLHVSCPGVCDLRLDFESFTLLGTGNSEEFSAANPAGTIGGQCVSDTFQISVIITSGYFIN